MREDEAYLEIAKRFIQSCDEHIYSMIDIQEVIAFKAYHAFESLGAAFLSHFGNVVPKSHKRKINAFVSNSNRSSLVNGRIVSVVAMVVSSMRNKFLYPEFVSGNYKNPKDQISITDAKKMVKRVKGILREVQGII